MRQICTPRKPFTQPGSDDRERFYISKEDAAVFRRGKWTATVTDLDTGTKYTLQAAPCTIPTCYCDAVILHAEPVALSNDQEG